MSNEEKYLENDRPYEQASSDIDYKSTGTISRRKNILPIWNKIIYGLLTLIIMTCLLTIIFQDLKIKSLNEEIKMLKETCHRQTS